MSSAASSSFRTWYGAWKPLWREKKAGNSLDSPKAATQTPWVSCSSRGETIRFEVEKKGTHQKNVTFSFYPAGNHLSLAQGFIIFINSILSPTFFKARDKYGNWLDRIWFIETQETCTSFACAWNRSKGMQLSLAQYWAQGNNLWSEDTSWADWNINEFCWWLRNIDTGCHLKRWPWCFPT